MGEQERVLTGADVSSIAEAVRNWGRWGVDDERGTLNFLTEAKRAAAGALVREGAVVSCARSLDVTPSAENPNPVQHLMIRAADAIDNPIGFGGMADFIGLAVHGAADTHVDALCHIFMGAKMYNGHGPSAVRSDGAHRNSIMAAADGIVGRGVLLDICRLRDVDWLEPGEAITAADLDAAEAREGVEVGEGDILLVATGRDACRAAQGPWNTFDRGLAGLYADCIPWLHARRVAALGSDGISDVMPSRVEGWRIPIHQVAIVAMGLHLIDNMALDRLMAACRARQRWEFLCVIAPLRLERGTGSPVNPLAIF